jgi:hypothetical protein
MLYDSPVAAPKTAPENEAIVIMIALHNKHLTVGVDESLGGEITQIQSNGVDLLAYYDWESPVGSRQSSGYGHERHDWLSDYRGGWQLLVPNAGPECDVDGVHHPFHGEWSRTRVTIEEQTQTAVTMRAGTRTPVVVQRRVWLENNPPRLLVSTRVHNDSPERTSFIWGEHPAFAVASGDRVDLPAARVADGQGNVLGTWPLQASSDNRPRIDVVTSDAPHETVHFVTDLPAGWAALHRSRVSVAMAWDARDFPHVWLWREHASAGFPFFGRAWPGIGLAEARRRGQAITLAPGESRSTTVAIVPFVSSGASVTGVSTDGTISFGAPR